MTRIQPSRGVTLPVVQDELGLLVWQDLMFACGAYPAQVDEFRANVEAEVEAVVKRLRSHPSLAIFAGNNED
jgi:beta-mannosidase